LAYRYRRSEELGPGTRRIARELIDKTSRVLTNRSVAVESRIHEARKAIKKLRALLRLVRPASASEEAFSDGDAYLRDTARLLSGYRDDDVLRATVVQLVPDKAASSAIQGVLLAPRKSGNGVKMARAKAIEAVAERMTRFGESVNGWRFRSPSLDALEPGYQATLAKARRQKLKAMKHPTEKRLHGWRKHVKYHHYHTGLLANLDDGRSKSRANGSDRLQELLGRHHDIAVLAHRLKEGVRAGIPSDAVRPLRNRLKRASRAIEHDVRTLGHELF
jgi:CHAD domain-containing protein